MSGSAKTTITKSEYRKMLRQYVHAQYENNRLLGFFGMWALYAVKKKEFDKLLVLSKIEVEDD